MLYKCGSSFYIAPIILILLGIYIDQNCMKWSALYSIITNALQVILYPCNQQVKSWNHMSLIKEYICTFSSLKFNCVILQRDYIYIVNRFIFCLLRFNFVISIIVNTGIAHRENSVRTRKRSCWLCPFIIVAIGN